MKVPQKRGNGTSCHLSVHIEIWIHYTSMVFQMEFYYFCCLDSPIIYIAPSHCLSFVTQLTGPNVWDESTSLCSAGTWVPASTWLTVLGWNTTHLSPSVCSLSLYISSQAWYLETEQLTGSWHLAVKKEPRLWSRIWMPPLIDCGASSTVLNLSVLHL